ncbi:interleukin-1 receptor-associated kinase 1-binding protein 1 homolog [Clavelina lepadiformis]|uniref:interleukin-1 receptor-associated kinase 1-binding protein 1 homolog n=1 Tax=Clavelina lepadiformis TaxID=159417 RepID=UPI00404178F7
MCSKKKISFEPTHIFANLSPQLLRAGDEKQENETEARKVEVSGSAEFILPPDQCILTVLISNKKDKSEEAKASVARRLEYVTQTLYNHGVQKHDTEITKNLSRIGGRGWFNMEAQVDALFHNDLHKCLQLKNLFTEKLDSCVKVLPVVLQHDKQHIEATRKQTCLTALANARQKAAEICKLMGQALGRPIFITENIVREWKGVGSLDANSVTNNAEQSMLTVAEVTSPGPLEIQRKLRDQSISIRVDVTATFEIRPKFERDKKRK